MNGFKKRAIRKWEIKAENWVRSHIALTIIALILGLLTLRGVVGAVQTGNPFSVKQIIISAISTGVETDAYGHTNILLLGVGGEGHDGAQLTDTMIVASIDHKGKIVPMLSIPRDLYVENDVLAYGTRLNSVYEYITDKTGNPEKGMKELVDEVENILDINIHYYAKVDFEGFEDIVDAIGGIEVTVEESIYDPFYPSETRGYYSPFSIEAGTQTLDGDTALRYVRSRQTTSDFDRARRQQQVITAIKEKALSIGFLLNPSKIKNTLAAISDNFETNLSVSEMLNLAGMAGEFDSDSVTSVVLSDEAYKTGGFLYTPDREEYGGAFVLVPFSGDFSEIQMFAQLFFYHPEIYLDRIPIQVLNGTKEGSLAGLTKMYLVRYGFNVIAYGNAANTEVDDTTIFTVTDDESIFETVELLPSLTFGEILSETPADYEPTSWTTDADIIIELGEDFVDYYYEHDERFYIGFY